VQRGAERAERRLARGKVGAECGPGVHLDAGWGVVPFVTRTHLFVVVKAVAVREREFGAVIDYEVL
jgi:hypothetical protein